MAINYLTEPHVHQCVPRLANFSHVQVTRPRRHQSWGHASWIRCIQTSQLGEKQMDEDNRIMLLLNALHHYVYNLVLINTVTENHLG